MSFGSEDRDTIAAIATASGDGGIAIVRISGDQAENVFGRVFVPRNAKAPYESHRLMYGHVTEADGSVIDECMGVIMRAPNSYTREDVCELQTHGGSAAAAAVLRRITAEGVRVANPGEFTKRAFLNGRIDLSQAEAVMGIIEANGRAALQTQVRQLGGGSLRFIRGAQERLIGLLSGLEAHIDYPDEISEEEATDGLVTGLHALITDLRGACRERAARVVRDGLHVTLCGAPNAGKSTLFNRLIGEERAIVTSTAGTTRDVLDGSFMLNDVPVHLKDTAGLRESSDAIEQIGVQRAQNAMEQADVLLWVIDASDAAFSERCAEMELPADLPCAVLCNKTDIARSDAESVLRAMLPERTVLSVSAETGDGIDAVLDFLRPYAALPKGDFLTHERHLQLCAQVIEKLESALHGLEAGDLLDLSAIDMHDALYLLGRITGDSVDEKLLDEVFDSFCVGK